LDPGPLGRKGGGCSGEEPGAGTGSLGSEGPELSGFWGTSEGGDEGDMMWVKEVVLVLCDFLQS